MVTTFKDVAGILLLTLLLPVWMAVGLGLLGAIVIRQLYWWARGNTTVVSRSAHGRSLPRHGASALSPVVAGVSDREAPPFATMEPRSVPH
jgi:hypothetical protein